MMDCMIYFVVFGIVFILNALAMVHKNKKIIRRSLLASSFLVLLLFIGLRYNVGTDYDNYLSLYKSIGSMSWSKIFSLHLEPIMTILFKVCSYILPDPRLIFVVLGGLMLFPIYKANKIYNYKYLAYSVLVFCILFLPFGLNGMRQGVAMSFTLLAFIYFIKNNFKKGILNFVIAVLCHTSSLIVAPYLLMIFISRHKKIKFTTLNIIFTLSLSAIVMFFLNDWLIENGVTRYSYILGNVDLESISFNSLVFYFPILLLMLFDGDKECGDEIPKYKNLTISSLIFLVVGTSAQYLSRFSLYFMMPTIIMLPMLIQNIPQKNMRMIVKCLFFIFLIIFFYMQYAVYGKHEILPYQTWLFGGLI